MSYVCLLQSHNVIVREDMLIFIKPGSRLLALAIHSRYRERKTR